MERWPPARARSGRILEADRRDRRAPRAALDPRADADDAPRASDGFLKVEHSRYLAEHIPGARYVELEGADSLFSLGDTDAILGRDRGVPHRRSATSASPTAMLATVLFTDICGSTERAAEMGDRAWRGLLERHDELVPAAS